MALSRQLPVHCNVRLSSHHSRCPCHHKARDRAGACLCPYHCNRYCPPHNLPVVLLTLQSCLDCHICLYQHPGTTKQHWGIFHLPGHHSHCLCHHRYWGHVDEYPYPHHCSLRCCLHSLPAGYRPLQKHLYCHSHHHLHHDTR